MYGFPTKSLRSKDSEGMYGLCTSTDTRGDMFTDRQVATDCNAYTRPVQKWTPLVDNT